MGFRKAFRKVFRPVRKVVKKIIPKEIKPFLPYAAAAFGPAGLAGTKFAALSPAFQKALIAGVTSAATDEQGNPLRTALLAGAPDVLSQGLGSAGRVLGNVNPESKLAQFLVSKGTGLETTLNNPGLNMSTAKILGAQASVDQAAKLAEINQDEIDKYNEQLRKQGVLDKTKRRTSIYNIYINAGYEPDYVNSMLDRYGYESGGRIGFAQGLGIFEEDILEQISRGYKGSKDAMKAMFTKKKKKKKPEMTVSKTGDIIVNFPDDEDRNRDSDFKDALMTAKEGIEMAYKTPGPKPVPMMKFARGGEVEIEEETDDLNILDFMKDQGIEYGEQASYGFDDAMGESFEMFQDYRKRGLIPLEMEFDEFLEIMRDSKKSKEGIMQMASGYKTDIEEMYEQYVFEMEEQGLQPMSFSEFLTQARAGMADGGRAGYRKGGAIMKLVNLGMDPSMALSLYEDWKDSGSSLSFEDYVGYGTIDNYKDGGEVSSADRQIEMLIKKGADNDLIKTYVEGSQDGVIDQIRESMKKRQNKAGGGIMEKDMRGGGFIPEGTKERADDVPARLSKNEFVMTADAVRAAGGGSVNKGAKRMYDMMYQLEGKV